MTVSAEQTALAAAAGTVRATSMFAASWRMDGSPRALGWSAHRARERWTAGGRPGAGKVIHCRLRVFLLAPLVEAPCASSREPAAGTIAATRPPTWQLGLPGNFTKLRCSPHLDRRSPRTADRSPQRELSVAWWCAARWAGLAPRQGGRQATPRAGRVWATGFALVAGGGFPPAGHRDRSPWRCSRGVGRTRRKISCHSLPARHRCGDTSDPGPPAVPARRSGHVSS